MFARRLRVLLDSRNFPGSIAHRLIDHYRGLKEKSSEVLSQFHHKLRFASLPATDNSNGFVRLLGVSGETPPKLQLLLALRMPSMPNQTVCPLVFMRVLAPRWEFCVSSR